VRAGSEAPEFDLADAKRFGGDHVTQGVGGIVAADSLIVDVGFEDIPGAVGVMLQIGEAFEQVFAALVNEEGGFDAGGGVAETLEDGRPAVLQAKLEELFEFELGGWGEGGGHKKAKG